MTIRDALDHTHEVECECDRCHYNTYTHEFHMLDNYIDPVGELCDCLRSDGWIVTDDEEFICPECQAMEAEEEASE
jgi:hypothetical protein